MRTLCTMACLTLLALACAAGADGPGLTQIDPGKKLIEWGWDEPSPAFMRANAKRMDRMGFDGVIFHAEAIRDGNPVNFAWNCWSTQRFEVEEFAQGIADLKACEFTNMTDNFLRFNVCPGDVDWFDDEGFALVTHNAGVAATVARDGGCKGFMFDVEMYNNKLFHYPSQALAEDKSFEDYEAKVRQRGREFIESINEQYPDITVLLTFGYGITGVGGDRTKASYGLLKNFLDGVFEAAGDETVIVDAYEGAYPFRKHAQFEAAYKTVRRDMAQYSAVPDKYRKHVSVGFGVWMDMAWRTYGWNRDDFEKNYFLPEEFEYSVFSGLDVTDRYVWIYTEVPLWWTRNRLPAAYRKALKNARRPHVIDDSEVGRRPIKDAPVDAGPVAAKQPGYSDEATFGDLADKYTFLADLPKVWKFRTDPKKQGVKGQWFATDLDLEGWRDMEIGKFWDEQGVQYTGDAWYRLTWDTPAADIAEGAKLALWFGAVDETARVWVNGVNVGDHDIGGDAGWDKRFPIDVSAALKPGETNVIAVHVGNSGLAGGIWKSVRLAVEK